MHIDIWSSVDSGIEIIVFVHSMIKHRSDFKMILILLKLLFGFVFILVLLDFIVRTFTTYNAGKAIPGPYMYPIVGALKFFCSPQGTPLRKKGIHRKKENKNQNLFITDKTFKLGMDYVKQFPQGFAYWSFGVFVYHIYSAEAIEVSKFCV